MLLRKLFFFTFFNFYCLENCWQKMKERKKAFPTFSCLLYVTLCLSVNQISIWISPLEKQTSFGENIDVIRTITFGNLNNFDCFLFLSVEIQKRQILFNSLDFILLQFIYVRMGCGMRYVQCYVKSWEWLFYEMTIARLNQICLLTV